MRIADLVSPVCLVLGWLALTGGASAVAADRAVLAVWLLSIGAALFAVVGYVKVWALLRFGVQEVLDAGKESNDDDGERRSVVRRVVVK